MAITLTNRQFVNAINTGAYRRFSSIRKTITAGHKNRKVPRAVDEELATFVKTQDELLARFGGVIDKKTNEVVYPEGKKEEADKAHAEWMAQIIELPGEPIKLADLLEGGLCETDYQLLEPFLTE